MKSLAIILVCAGVVAALFANQIDKVARQNNVIKTILDFRRWNTFHLPSSDLYVVRCSNKCFFRLLGGYRYNHRGDDRLSAPPASDYYRKNLPHMSGKKEEPDGRLKPAKLGYRRHASNRPVWDPADAKSIWCGGWVSQRNRIGSNYTENAPYHIAQQWYSAFFGYWVAWLSAESVGQQWNTTGKQTDCRAN